MMRTLADIRPPTGISECSTTVFQHPSFGVSSRCSSRSHSYTEGESPLRSSLYMVTRIAKAYQNQFAPPGLSQVGLQLGCGQLDHCAIKKDQGIGDGA